MDRIGITKVVIQVLNITKKLKFQHKKVWIYIMMKFHVLYV